MGCDLDRATDPAQGVSSQGEIADQRPRQIARFVVEKRKNEYEIERHGQEKQADGGFVLTPEQEKRDKGGWKEDGGRERAETHTDDAQRICSDVCRKTFLGVLYLEIAPAPRICGVPGVPIDEKGPMEELFHGVQRVRDGVCAHRRQELLLGDVFAALTGCLHPVAEILLESLFLGRIKPADLIAKP